MVGVPLQPRSLPTSPRKSCPNFLRFRSGLAASLITSLLHSYSSQSSFREVGVGWARAFALTARVPIK